MPKVLRIINRFNLGGPTYNAVYLTDLLSKGEPDEVRFETRLVGGSPIKGESHSGYIATKSGVDYEEISEMSRSINPFNDFIALWKIIRIIREYKPDIVHTHAAKAGALGRVAAWLCRVPIVVHTYHGHVFSGYFGPYKSLIIRNIEKTLGKITTHIICISEKQFQDITVRFRIVAPAKASVVPLGFDLSRFKKNQEEKRLQFRTKYSLNADSIAVGIIGRFAPVKNHVLFIKSFAIAKRRNKDLRAFVIGDGESKEKLIQIANSFGLTTGSDLNCDMTFTSWIKNIEDALTGLDMVVLTSINEGTPVSLIEAQAASRPVVSTDAGGVRDCVQDQLTGFITTPDETEISSAILRLADSRELREMMGERGASFVENKFSHHRLVSDIRALYCRLIAVNTK